MSEDPIGYGKPPKAHQFQKGQSGNPKGRPKGAKSLKTVVQQELASRIEIKVQGKKTRTTKLEAAMMKLVNDALSGNTRALSELLRLAALHMPHDAEHGTDNLSPTEDDQALLAAYVARALSRQQKAQDDDDFI